MALFGAPIAHEDHAVRACYAALRMQDAIRRYTDELRRAQGLEVQIRVGLNSGEVVVRSIGSDLRMDYHLALSRWLLGYPDRSLSVLQDALRLAEELKHPLSTVITLWFAACVHYQRGDRETAAATADRLVALATEHAFSKVWVDNALLLSYVRIGARLDARALAEPHRRLVSAWAGGAVFRQVFCLCVLAELYAEAGHVDAGLEALASIPSEHRGAFCAPEIHRIEGELLLRHSDSSTDAAERCFRTAIDLARARAEKSFELRAATSLARLWQRRGKRDDARRLLGDVYAWFTEGFATADLRAAKALLDELS